MVYLWNSFPVYFTRNRAVCTCLGFTRNFDRVGFNACFLLLYERLVSASELSFITSLPCLSETRHLLDFHNLEVLGTLSPKIVSILLPHPPNSQKYMKKITIP